MFYPGLVDLRHTFLAILGGQITNMRAMVSAESAYMLPSLLTAHRQPGRTAQFRFLHQSELFPVGVGGEAVDMEGVEPRRRNNARTPPPSLEDRSHLTLVGVSRALKECWPMVFSRKRGWNVATRWSNIDGIKVVRELLLPIWLTPLALRMSRQLLMLVGAVALFMQRWSPFQYRILV